VKALIASGASVNAKSVDAEHGEDGETARRRCTSRRTAGMWRWCSCFWRPKQTRTYRHSFVVAALTNAGADAGLKNTAGANVWAVASTDEVKVVLASGLGAESARVLAQAAEKPEL